MRGSALMLLLLSACGGDKGETDSSDADTDTDTDTDTDSDTDTDTDTDSDTDTDTDTDTETDTGATTPTGSTGDTGGGPPVALVVPNHSFQDPPMTYAGEFVGSVASWSGGGVVWLGAGSMFQTNPLGPPADWTQALYLLNGATSTSPNLATIAAGTTYTATVAVAERLDVGLGQSGSSQLELLANGVVVAADTVPNTTLRAMGGSWYPLTAQFNASPSLAGQSLTVRLGSTDPAGQVVYDNVVVIAAP